MERQLLMFKTQVGKCCGRVKCHNACIITCFNKRNLRPRAGKYAIHDDEYDVDISEKLGGHV
jgi:hypothetical protein